MTKSEIKRINATVGGMVLMDRDGPVYLEARADGLHYGTACNVGLLSCGRVDCESYADLDRALCEIVEILAD